MKPCHEDKGISAWAWAGFWAAVAPPSFWIAGAGLDLTFFEALPRALGAAGATFTAFFLACVLTRRLGLGDALGGRMLARALLTERLDCPEPGNCSEDEQRHAERNGQPGETFPALGHAPETQGGEQEAGDDHGRRGQRIPCGKPHAHADVITHVLQKQELASIRALGKTDTSGAGTR